MPFSIFMTPQVHVAGDHILKINIRSHNYFAADEWSMPPDNPARACFDAARALQLEAGDGISTLPVTHPSATPTRAHPIACMRA